MDSMFSLNGKVAIVTGAGRGLGKAMALGLAGAGADVVAAARTAAQVEDTAAKIQALGRKSIAVPTDVREFDQVANLLNRALETFGRVDILVNNAGGTFAATVLETSLKGWEAVIRENLTTMFICTKIIGESMVKQNKGNIINIASIAGMGPFPTSAPYGVAKAGIINFTQTLAVEWAQYNIRVNAIAPGLIPTPGSNQIAKQLSGYRRAQISRIPLGRFGTPDDIVGAAIFLASDAASYMTGAVIVINGGLTSTVFGESVREA